MKTWSQLVDHPNYAIKNYIETLNDYWVSMLIVCKFGNTNLQEPYSLISLSLVFLKRTPGVHIPPLPIANISKDKDFIAPSSFRT